MALDIFINRTEWCI